MNRLLPVLVCAALVACVGCDKSQSAPAQKVTKPAVDTAPAEPQKATVIFETPAGDAPVECELARTPKEREIGLMHRTVLGADEGMLFIFTDDRVRTFWMKNTLISLDMIFVDKDLEVVGVVEAAEPRTLVARTVGIPSRYVVEVNAGWASEHGVGAGTSMRVQGITLK